MYIYIYIYMPLLFVLFAGPRPERGVSLAASCSSTAFSRPEPPAS